MSEAARVQASDRESALGDARDSRIGPWRKRDFAAVAAPPSADRAPFRTAILSLLNWIPAGSLDTRQDSTELEQAISEMIGLPMLGTASFDQAWCTSRLLLVRVPRGCGSVVARVAGAWDATAADSSNGALLLFSGAAALRHLLPPDEATAPLVAMVPSYAVWHVARSLGCLGVKVVAGRSGAFIVSESHLLRLARMAIARDSRRARQLAPLLAPDELSDLYLAL